MPKYIFICICGAKRKQLSLHTTLEKLKFNSLLTSPKSHVKNHSIKLLIFLETFFTLFNAILVAREHLQILFTMLLRQFLTEMTNDENEPC